MEYVGVADIARSWGVSERSVRDYCAKGRVPGAKLDGKTWRIPADATKPRRKNAASRRALLPVLRAEHEERVRGGIYHRLQVDMAYNSNHIEGSTLTHEQTRHIFETATIGLDGDTAVRVDDIVEASNHFRAFDLMIDRANSRPTIGLIKELHRLLKSGTSDASQGWFRVGDWKAYPNEVGGRETTPPEEVDSCMRELLAVYNSHDAHDLDDLLDFHVRFERIHPFQDGNGRVGRLIIFWQCLQSNIVPFIITDDLRLFYYRGIQNWGNINGYLRDTCLTAQDNFKGILDYYRISY
jgi:Fic family protein